METTNLWKTNKDGQTLIPVQTSGMTLEATSEETPEGAYTTFRTYQHNKVLHMKNHFDRLEETSALAGKNVKLNRVAITHRIAEIIGGLNQEDSRVRITIDLTNPSEEVYLAVEPLHVPTREEYEKGIDVISTEMHRDNPKAKLNAFMKRAEETRQAAGKKYEEILMRRKNGDILEGLSSNFYGICHEVIYTAEEGVLSGTTRRYVLDLANSCKIKVILKPINIKNITDLEESFITSTSRSILPVHSIDAVVMKSQVPGPVTSYLMKAFAEHLTQNLDTLV